MNYTVRKATVDDTPIIVHHRKAMFTDMRTADDALIEAMGAPYANWMTGQFADGRYHGWLAVVDDQVIAGAGLWLNDWIPSPILPSGRRGYILNVYTEPEFRKHGIARHLVEQSLEYCRAQGLKMVVLHASEQGRPIYEALGFTMANEMRLQI